MHGREERLPHRQRPENGEARDQEAEVDGEVQQRPPHVRLEALPGHGGRQLAQTRHVALPEGTFKLKFLWLEKNIGFAVDQVVGKSQHLTPVTEYFFWPRDDAWEELKAVLESKDWISEREKIELLNKTTEVINFWQDEETKHTIDEARSEFGDCLFMGA